MLISVNFIVRAPEIRTRDTPGTHCFDKKAIELYRELCKTMANDERGDGELARFARRRIYP